MGRKKQRAPEVSPEYLEHHKMVIRLGASNYKSMGILDTIEDPDVRELIGKMVKRSINTVRDL